MGNSVQVPTADEGAKAADTPMDSSMEKGKGKAPVAEPMDEDEEDSNSEEEPEEADEDNMEEIDMDNIVGSRTRGKNIDFAEAAKNMVEDDEDEEDDDEDFQDDDAMSIVPPPLILQICAHAATSNYKESDISRAVQLLKRCHAAQPSQAVLRRRHRCILQLQP
ncbi:hypothetical protein AC579_378 [Pseudocercospora musae]|uniref:Histone chaperone domain-containing protein n=1 Tax=Pseudocercospora musae TaxID=113226 RepID=A0A139ID17_9PEZI|nr:hypothetical protein AC579_378 [Pseudocercospora musae]